MTARHNPGLFIAGTDTAVGKTTLSRAFLAAARRAGSPWLACKPVETGCLDLRHPSDAQALLVASGAGLTLDQVCPYRFERPLAPAVAARQAQQPLAPPDLIAACNRLRTSSTPVLVESAGGLCSPLAPRFTSADLAQALGMPVVLCARNGLGTINHTALSLAELDRRGLALAGLLLVDTSPAEAPDHDSNLEAIAELTGIRPLCLFPHIPGATDQALAAALPDTVLQHLLAQAHGARSADR